MQVLVLDAIGERPHAAHLSIQEALDIGVLLQPRRLFFVGMDCCLEDQWTARRLDQWLTTHRQAFKAARGRDSRIERVALAHDGLFLNVHLAAAAAAAAAAHPAAVAAPLAADPAVVANAAR